jgi:alkylated DNA repair dioxygenase AlkB
MAGMIRKAPRQLSFLDPAAPWPAGLKYQGDLLSSAEEAALAERIAVLPLKEFEFHGHLGKRRVISYGWRYDFSGKGLQQADDIPDFLLPVRERAAEFGGIPAPELQHVLLTEYGPGAGIGWHKDRPEFGDVIGLSLVSRCIFRLRRKVGTAWKRATFIAQPRSAYLLHGAARTEWLHSIPPVDTLRYSITFRQVRPKGSAREHLR